MEDHRSNEIVTKIAATQSVIKNKFEKACANRLEHERDVNQMMQPLTAAATKTFSSPTIINDSASQKDDFSLRNLSNSKNAAQQLRLATKSYSSYNNKSANMFEMYFDNPNKLCNRLRLLVTSRIEDNEITYRTKEIRSIIAKLQALGILI